MIIDAQFMIVLDSDIARGDFEDVEIELFDNCGGSELIASLTGMRIIGKVFAFLPEFGVVNSRFRATHGLRVRYLTI